MVGPQAVENSSNRRGQWTGSECLLPQSSDSSKTAALLRSHLTNNSGRCFAFGIADCYFIAFGNTSEEGFGIAIIFLGQVDVRLTPASRDC